MKLSANFAMSREIYMHAYLTRKCRPLYLNIFRQWCSRWLETATAGKLRQLFSRARNAIGLLMPSLLMPFLGSLEECATSSRCHWLEQSSVFVGRMGNIAIYLRLPCWRFTRRNLPIHSELVSGVFRVGLQEGFPNVANIYIFFFFFFSEHIIVRTSLPIMSLPNWCLSSATLLAAVIVPNASGMSFSHLCLGFHLLLFPATIPCIIVFSKPLRRVTLPKYLSFWRLTKLYSQFFGRWSSFNIEELVQWAIHGIRNILR